MQRRRNNVMVFDTETINDCGHPLVHDIGWVCLDKELGIVRKRRFLIAEFHQLGKNLLYNNEFYSQYSKEYHLARKEVDILPWKDVRDILLADMRQCKISTIAAYNIGFDYRALSTTESFFNRGLNDRFLKVVDGKTILDLWYLACSTVLDTDEYRKWCEENGAISEKGNFKTSAESCYRYLFGSDYVEAHTALSDAVDEARILKYIVDHCKGDFTYGLQGQPWRLVQRKER